MTDAPCLRKAQIGTATSRPAQVPDLEGFRTPDFASGVNILKFSGQGNGTHAHMYIDDEKRSVQLIA